MTSRTLQQRLYPCLLTFLRRQPQKADLLITHHLPLCKAQRGFEVFSSREAVKVVLEP